MSEYIYLSLFLIMVFYVTALHDRLSEVRERNKVLSERIDVCLERTDRLLDLSGNLLIAVTKVIEHD
jgi:hypothetical protein